MHQVSYLSLCPGRLQPEGRTLAPKTQRGVVLIVALVILVIISLLAVTSLRNVSSSETISGTVRTSELASQAAEIALRYCESQASKLANGEATAAGFVISTKDWSDIPNTWDAVDADVVVVPASEFNNANVRVTYKRFPECLVAQLSSTPTPPSSFLITARGFGPDVAVVNNNRSRPKGTEVWLQSTIEF